MTKPREFTITLHGGPCHGRQVITRCTGYKHVACYRSRGRLKYANYRYTSIDQKAWTVEAKYVPTPRKRKKPLPSKSAAQHRLMEGAAHSKAFAKKVGVPQKVAKEFVHADQAAGKYKGKKKK